MDSTEHTNISTLELLSERELEHEHGETEEEEAAQVGHKEEGTTPLEAEVGETPEVTKTNGGTDGGEHKGVLGGPSLSLSVFHFLVFVSEGGVELVFVSEGVFFSHRNDF